MKECNEEYDFSINIKAINEDEEKILRLFTEAFLLRRKKGKDYGSCWRDLGSKKQWGYMYDKIMRLKNVLWFNKNPKNESVRDSLIDCLNYNFHTLVLWDEENEKR